jgi:aminoglycoside phosphotransferase family enzyme/predicted kinase
MPIADVAGDKARLVRALDNPTAFGDSVVRVERIETHISYVFLTGAYAYKIKKAVTLGFLDFSTLDARRHFCEEELRLNRRLAPGLYLDVVAITGSPDNPVVGGAGPALEYAVKMREFPQDALASRMLARGEFDGMNVDRLAAQVAAFHERIEVAAADGPYAVPAEILQRADDNFAQVRPLLDNNAERAALDILADWTRHEHALRATVFDARRRRGFVRECHGDLHLGNIAILDGAVAIFDCIEFNDHLRWIDVMSEVAFAVMDMQDRKRPDLAYRFLNGWLEITGDYEGIAVLRFYLVYRAMVRAKVARLRAAQVTAPNDKRPLLAEYESYVALARADAHSRRPAIVITHGLSGCGKTTASQALLERAAAIRIRTDVERKRLRGVADGPSSSSGIERGRYSPQATAETYQRVLALTRAVANAGSIVIVDGAFLRRWQRDLFRGLATELRIPFAILAFDASEATLRQRVTARVHAGTDASEADISVLENQLSTREPLDADELAFAVPYDAELPKDHACDADTWRLLLERLELVR